MCLSLDKIEPSPGLTSDGKRWSGRMAFNLKRFLRRAPAEVLRQYLDARKSSLSGRVDWQDPTQTQPDALFATITA